MSASIPSVAVNSQIGVFCVHGFCGHPEEYREVRELLEGLGFKTAAPSLVAHGDRRDVLLKDMTIEEALETLRDDFRHFAQGCEQVVLLGHSMGGLLSAILASEKDEYHGVPNLRGLVLVSTPHHRGYWVNAFWDLLTMDVTDFFPGLRYVSEAKTGLPAPQFKPWWRGRIKEEAEALFTLAELRLPDISVPTWLMHSPLDLIVPYGDMMTLANAIDKPELITMVPLEKCGHQVFPTSRAQLKAINVILEALRTSTAASLPEHNAVPVSSSKHQFDSVGADALSVIAASHRRQSAKSKI